MRELTLTLAELRVLGASALAGVRGQLLDPPMADAARLSALCRRHRITTLIHAAAPDAGLREEALALGVRTLSRLETIQDVLSLLAVGGVRAIPVKGGVLARQLYPDASFRPFDDLDLIVRDRIETATARRLLVGAGWQVAGGYSLRVIGLMERFGVETKLHPPPGLLPVELSWRPDECWLGCLPTQALSEWDPSAHLAYVALHGLRHRWSRLIWLVDVYLLVSALREHDRHALVAKATRWRCCRVLGLALSLAGDVLGDPTCSGLAAHFPQPSPAVMDACRAQLCGPERVLAPAHALRWFIQMQDSRSRGLRVAGHLLTTPSYGDFTVVPLPLSLALLYYFVRPFRVLTGAGPRRTITA